MAVEVESEVLLGLGHEIDQIGVLLVRDLSCVLDVRVVSFVVSDTVQYRAEPGVRRRLRQNVLKRRALTAQLRRHARPTAPKAEYR